MLNNAVAIGAFVPAEKEKAGSVDRATLCHSPNTPLTIAIKTGKKSRFPVLPAYN